MTLEEAAEKFPIGARVKNLLNGVRGTVEAANSIKDRLDGAFVSNSMVGEIFIAVRWDTGMHVALV